MPGMTVESMSSEIILTRPDLGATMPKLFSLSLPTKIMPPRGPRRVLWVVVVTTSQ